MSTGTNSAEIRITDVIAHPLTQTLPRPTVTSWGTYTEVSIVLVEVRTDAGITGVGEALARFSPKAYAELIETSLKPRLVGGNPTDIQAHWRTMRRALSGRAGGCCSRRSPGSTSPVGHPRQGGRPARTSLARRHGPDGGARLCGFGELGQRRVHGPGTRRLSGEGIPADQGKVAKSRQGRMPAHRPPAQACRRRHRALRRCQLGLYAGRGGRSGPRLVRQRLFLVRGAVAARG